MEGNRVITSGYSALKMGEKKKKITENENRTPIIENKGWLLKKKKKNLWKEGGTSHS